MLLPARPLTDRFPIAYPFDPAFDTKKHQKPLDEHATKESIEAMEAEAQSLYFQDFWRCAQTCDYTPLCIPPHTPTLFWCRPIGGTKLRRLRGAVSADVLRALAVRISLDQVELGGAALERIDRAVDPEHAWLGQIVTPDYMDLLEQIPTQVGRIAGDLVDIFGMHILNRSLAPSPP